MDKAKKKNIIITGIVLLVLVVVVIVGSIAYKQLSPTVAPPPPDTTVVPAPDFVALDWDGNEVRLSDFKGTPVILNFWASWCPPCKEEMPHFQTQYEKYNPNELAFIMLNFTGSNGETIESAKRYIQSDGYTFPVYFDTDFAAAKAYGINSVPLTLFINADGNIVTGAEGMLSEELLEKGVSMLLD